MHSELSVTNLYQDSDESTLVFEEMEEPDLIVGSEEMVLEFADGTSYVHYFDADEF